MDLLRDALGDALRRVVAMTLGRERERPDPLTEHEELELALEYERTLGWDRPLEEQSKEAHALAEGAPVVRWTPPALRQHV